ncbi:MAG: hypothetical protein GY870_01780 [archaeon]|nr:hypothetical protein [archaeon]
MLNKKKRVSIFLIVIIAILGSFLSLQTSIETGGGNVDLNPKNVYYFETDYTSTLIYENGTQNDKSDLIFSSHTLNTTFTNVTIENNGVISSFLAHPNGTVYQNGTLQGNYSIWWIYIPNVIMSFGADAGDEFNVVDPTGFLGDSNREYKLIIDRKEAYWPIDLELRDLLGAQNSIIAELWDETDVSDIRLISTITYDITCGLVEIIEGSHSDSITLTLKTSNFPISRNRILFMTVFIILSILILIGSFLLMSIKWKQEFLLKIYQNNEDRNEILLLLISGLIAGGIEIIDIWFYLPFGMFGNLGIHLAYTFLIFLICWKQKYKYGWIIPSLLEIGFVFSLNFVTGYPYVPPLTAFMGSMCSWLMIVYASGIEKYCE